MRVIGVAAVSAALILLSGSAAYAASCGGLRSIRDGRHADWCESGTGWTLAVRQKIDRPDVEAMQSGQTLVSNGTTNVGLVALAKYAEQHEVCCYAVAVKVDKVTDVFAMNGRVHLTIRGESILGTWLLIQPNGVTTESSSGLTATTGSNCWVETKTGRAFIFGVSFPQVLSDGSSWQASDVDEFIIR